MAAPAFSGLPPDIEVFHKGGPFPGGPAIPLFHIVRASAPYGFNPPNPQLIRRINQGVSRTITSFTLGLNIPPFRYRPYLLHWYLLFDTVRFLPMDGLYFFHVKFLFLKNHNTYADFNLT